MYIEIYILYAMFQLFVVQLETEHIHGKLSLQKLWFYIQPTMLTMSILSQITSTICKVGLKYQSISSNFDYSKYRMENIDMHFL